jgi:geranylgeranyl diphosphate synthase type I
VTPSPLDAEDLRTRVQKTLDDFVGTQVPRLDAISDDLGPFVDAVTTLVSGGKRLRPAFCYWGWRGAGGADDEPAVRAATALELLHACALLHDDVMDGSDLRRGRPSAHRRFEELHRSSGWFGPPERFGTGAAILAGDLCMAWADELFFSSGLPAEALLRAKPVYDAMRTELMAGQYLDLLAQASGAADPARAMRVLRYKSAKYTVERPLHLGAELAGAPPDLVAAYTAYGVPLGEAFQLRDDLLGVFGDPAVTGKPAGDDLREGKRTVLVDLTLASAGRADAEALRSRLGDPTLDDDAVAEVRALMVRSGAVERVEDLIGDLTTQALRALDDSRVGDAARGVLADLAVAATDRKG